MSNGEREPEAKPDWYGNPRPKAARGILALFAVNAGLATLIIQFPRLRSGPLVGAREATAGGGLTIVADQLLTATIALCVVTVILAAAVRNPVYAMATSALGGLTSAGSAVAYFAWSRSDRAAIELHTVNFWWLLIAGLLIGVWLFLGVYLANGARKGTAEPGSRRPSEPRRRRRSPLREH